MTPRERFLASLLRPLAGSGELGLDARRQTEKWIDCAGAGDAELLRAAERLDRRDAQRAGWGKWRRSAKLPLVLAALAALLLPLVHPVTVALRNGRRWWRYLEDIPGAVETHAYQCRDYISRSLFEPTTTGGEFRAALTRGVGPEQALMLLGDPEIESPAARAEALWRDHFPDDPAAFYNFLRFHLLEHRELPEGALETAEKLDPENGYAALLAAGTALKYAAQKKRVPVKHSKPGAPSKSRVQWKILDEKKMVRGLELFHRAAAKPVCTGRIADWNRRCTAGFRPTDDASTHMARFAWACTHPTALEYFRSLNNGICAESIRLEKEGDREALARMADDWLKITPKIAAGRDDLATMFAVQSSMFTQGKPLLAACESLGLEEQARAIGKAVDSAEQLYEERRKTGGASFSSFYEWSSRPAFRQAAISHRFFLPVSNASAGVVEIDPRDLTPGRLADRCDFEWLAIRPVGLAVLLFSGLAALFWRFMSRPAWNFGKRLAQSLNATDWAWILGLGVVAPVAWYAAATRMPVFHVRELGLNGPGIFVAPLQSAAALLLLLSALIQATRWRLARRLRVLGFGTRRFARGGWLPVVFAALALPATGLFAFIGVDWAPGIAGVDVFKDWPGFVWPFVPAALLLAVPFLWLVGLPASVFAGRGDRTPFRAAAAYVFASAGAPAVLILALAASPAVKLEFRHWLLRDSITSIDPKYDGMTKYEFKLAEYLRGRVLKAFE